ncbi:MAG: RnfABCDGE type electron transport complex subunit G [Bacteroidales bacterium]
MAKMESSFKNMLLVLFIITFVAGFALSGVYNITKEPIAKSKLAKKIAALNTVLPEFDTVISLEAALPEEKPVELSIAIKNHDTVGYAVETYTSLGFGGNIRAMVGFEPDGTIIDVVHLEHSETPGLGDKIEKSKSSWSDQFKGKNPETFKLIVKKDGGDVDAITAATITSRAYSDAITRAYKIVKAQKGENNDE